MRHDHVYVQKDSLYLLGVAFQWAHAIAPLCDRI